MFLEYIQFFRALAITFIVAGHSIDAFLWTNDPAFERWLRIIMSNGSLMFVFIAGYLFQHLLKKYNTKKYYISKLKNVILPYILVSIPAIFVFVFLQHREGVWEGFYDHPPLVQISLFYATGIHLAPLWFVPMIAIFYLIAPLLAAADKNRRIYYGLPLFILLSCLVERGLPFVSFIHFFSVYLFGMFCSHYKEQLNPIFRRIDFLLVMLFLAIVFAAVEFYTTERTMTFYNYLQKMLLSVFFLGVFFRFNQHLHSNFITTVANTSFGVFFIHSYVLTGSKMIYQKIFGSLPQGNLLMYILTSLTALLVCVLAITIIQKIMGTRSRYLVGS